MKHSLGGKNGWCGTCVKKPGDPESNCPRDGDTVDTIARSGKNWGFCSDLCSKTDEAPIDILQETKLDVLSLKDCGVLQGQPLGIDILYLVLADRNMQVSFGLKVVWGS